MIWSVGRDRPGEEPAGVEPLEPLAVEDVGLGSAFQSTGLAGVDETNVEPTGLEQLEEGDPVDAGRFESDTGNSTGLEPIGQGDQVGRVSAEAPDGLGIGV